MGSVILVGIGGFAGSIARYLVDTWMMARLGTALPWGTLLINVSGSFVLGLLFAVVTERGLLPPELRWPLMIGFLGAYTTFSTFMFESWRLIEGGQFVWAAANLIGSVCLGLAAVAVGLLVGRSI